MRKVRQARFVGQKVRRIRKAKNLTQMELANRIGVQQSDLSRMEKGEYRVSLDTLFRILQVFEMTMGDFFGEVTMQGVSAKEHDLLKKYNTLSDESKEDVIDFIGFLKMKEDNHYYESD